MGLDAGPILAGATDTSAGAAAVADARAAVAVMRHLGITAADAGSWPVANRREVLDLVRAAIDGLGTVRGAVLVAERDSQAWKGTGAGSFEGWVGTASREGKKAATKQIREAEQLDTVAEVTSAVTGGEIALEHAKLIARLAAEGTPVQRAAAVSPAGQEYLIGLARVQDLPTFAITLARWAAELDPVGVDDAHEARRRERYLHVAVGDDMTVVKGQLDNVTGRHLILALEALTPAPASATTTATAGIDVRDIGQRNADALDTMARSVLASADTKPGAYVPVQISFILTEATWLAAKAARDARRAALATFGLSAEPEDPGKCGDTNVPVSYAPATWEDGTPVPFTVLAAAMCDCALTRIVIDADGTPVDLGRSQRLFTGAQRRAVIARDRHCSWPGCTIAARWCDVHHILWWERDNGPTSVENGMLLCNFHHHETHRRDLAITRTRAKNSGDGIALVSYLFADRTGREIGADGRVQAKAESPSTNSPPQSPTPRRRTRFEPPDELDLASTQPPDVGLSSSEARVA
ncbi:MAG: DUF222 domain-containing protein [Cellulomonas sp.]|nr:DUF222 domain-containing protein [Cellulomonas sp.]